MHADNFAFCFQLIHDDLFAVKTSRILSYLTRLNSCKSHFLLSRTSRRLASICRIQYSCSEGFEEEHCKAATEREEAIPRGSRFIDLDVFRESLQSCTHCQSGPLSFYNVTDEVRYGLASTFVIKCPFCGKSNQVKTSGQHRSGKCGPPAFDINTRLVLGCLHAGIGQTHINNVLSTLNAPTLNSVTFKLREREVGKAVESIAKSSCQNWREKNEALQNVMRVISFQYPVPLTWEGRDLERAIIRALDKQQL
ncbi:uncharacterized protein [Montipora capricornis]|uniref:uncharacterized protein isoform X1 n=1 Tax=Montipora capricornis TaxID=246305 RepID=UPI0035F1E96E